MCCPSRNIVVDNVSSPIVTNLEKVVAECVVDDCAALIINDYRFDKD